MKILHLNSNFLYTNIYKNQLQNMSNDFEHIIYNPVKSSNKKVVSSEFKVFEPCILTKFDSIFTFRRLKKSISYLQKNVDIKTFNGIHAHTLSNDGLLAYNFYKKYGIPYIVTIRNTDVNFALKYKPHLKNIYIKVLYNAKTIIFPNKVYENKLSNILKDKELNKEIQNKSLIVPNGIDEFWISNSNDKTKYIANDKFINLLFVGRIYKNKNLHNILEAISNSKINFKLTIIGKVIDLNYFNKIDKKYHFQYLGELTKEEIIKEMNYNDIFIMPSFKETFGLVYIEALSQNLPIIFTENEGIYGYFLEGEVGYSVNPYNILSIQKALDLTIKNYDKLQERLKDKSFLNKFQWSNIGKQYEKIYKGNF